jgi:protein SCO1
MIMSRGKILLVYAIGVLLGGFAIGSTLLQLTHPPQLPLAQIKPLPDFQLTERSGKTVRLADLKGKVWLADFIYTTCTGPCPMISHRLADLQKDALKNPDVRFVSISTNPDTDTPTVLQHYAENLGASPERWLFLTGEKAKVHALIRDGFMSAVVEQPNEAQPIIHSTKLMLVDKNGVIRNLYDGAPNSESSGPGEGNETILRDIERLLREGK